jgi:ABC-type branched-subunit amino acid transport system permease subunit
MLGFILLMLLVAATVIIAVGPWFKGLRTVIVARLTIAWGFVLPVLHDMWASVSPFMTDVVGQLRQADWREIIQPGYAPVVILLLGILFEILRRRTATPVGKA